MANKDLKLTPSHIRVEGDAIDAWWYEENDGAHIVVERDGGTFAHAKISWASLRKALARKDKPVKKKLVKK